MIYAFILAIDPSGNFQEGKGTTGWAVLEQSSMKITNAGNLYAKKYNTKELYWQAHLKLIETYHKKYKNKLIVVIEDYILYESKAQNQINSRMETSKLIGVIQHYCWQFNIPYVMQLANEVKKRWSDEILHYKKILVYSKTKEVLPNRKGVLIDRHCKDAIRHAVHFATFKNNLKRIT